MIEAAIYVAGTIAAALVAYLGGRRQAKSSAHKTDADASATLTSTALLLVTELREEVSALKSEVTRLKVLVSALESEIVALGGDPKRLVQKYGDHT